MLITDTAVKQSKTMTVLIINIKRLIKSQFVKVFNRKKREGH